MLGGERELQWAVAAVRGSLAYAFSAGTNLHSDGAA